MRIGILTFHSEINYGSVLQAYAMQVALASLGYESLIIDKWEDIDNHRLLGPLVKKSPLFGAKSFLRGMLLCGDWNRMARSLKTIRFIRKYLHRTKYHFYNWTDAPDDLGVDLITIGSDQVWNPTIVPPPDYLMKYNPWKIPAIAYSASIGRHSFEKDWLQEYREGFARLKAIGVREGEAKNLIEKEGFAAEHVVDPTLLVDRNLAWSQFEKKKFTGKKLLVCYFLTENFDVLSQVLAGWAERNDAYVQFFFDHPPLGAFPSSRAGIAKWMQYNRLWRFGRVKGMMSADPKDFVGAFSSADWIVTNSFHGLMFSVIFKKNVRVVRPSSVIRKDMSSRIDEFANGVISGPLMKDSIQDALTSIDKGEDVEINELEIRSRREKSREWLLSAIKSAGACSGHGSCSNDEREGLFNQ